jgi:hypothetical protein
MPSNLEMNTNDNTAIHSLIDMLTRFVLVETFKWSTTDTLIPLHLDPLSYVNSTKRYLKQFILPQCIFNASELHRQKMNNFMLMNADVEIELKVNSNPFQQGALLLAFFPRSLSTSKFRAEGNEFLSSVTTTPHRILNLEESNTAKMTIPYANILDMINLTDTNDSYGVLNVYVLSKLADSVTPTTIDVTLRMRFVNLKLSVATDRSIMAQTQYITMERERLRKMQEYVRPTLIPGLVAQASEGETEGPVTRVSGAIATIGETLSGVPVIGTAARMIGWFARGMSRVAAVYGWSKPTDLTMPQSILNKPACYMGNVEGKDASHVLAQISDNAIDTSSINPSNEDELSLALLTGKPNFIGRYTVPKGSFTSNKLLFSWEASPWNTLMQQPHANGQDYALGGVSFAYLAYVYWRGGLTYNLSCIKTQYHSGRIIVVYFPNRQRSDVPLSFSEEMTTNDHIIYDLTAKEGDLNSMTMPFSVPYTSNEPWKLTQWKNQDGLWDATSFNTHIGTVAVYCLNELVCPPSVSQDVTFLLQHKAGKGMAVAVPRIQLQGGFAVAETPKKPDAELNSVINDVYADAMKVPSAGSEEAVDFKNQADEIVIEQETSAVAKWVALEGESIELPDGSYDVNLNLAFTPTGYFTDGQFTFLFSVTDGLIENCRCDQILTSQAISTTTNISISSSTIVSFDATQFNQIGQRPLRLRGIVAQSYDGATEEYSSNTELAHGSQHDVSRFTTGEYCLSLRPLLKRFVNIAKIKGGDVVTRQPADFENFDSEDTTKPLGTRSYFIENDTKEGGGYLPESWLSLVSYLFRFCAGSTRTKVFIPWNATATSSLDMIDNIKVYLGRPSADPAFVQAGVVNNAVECSIPYYGQYKARTVGDDLRGKGSAQRITVSGTTDALDYYEAAGDDFSFWYLVGPPVMRPIDVNATSIPTLTIV